MLMNVWVQRAQAAETEAKQIRAYSQQQQACLEELQSESLSRPIKQDANDSALQTGTTNDSDASRQLLSQVPAMTHCILLQLMQMQSYHVGMRSWSVLAQMSKLCNISCQAVCVASQYDFVKCPDEDSMIICVCIQHA